MRQTQEKKNKTKSLRPPGLPENPPFVGTSSKVHINIAEAAREAGYGNYPGINTPSATHEARKATLDKLAKLQEEANKFKKPD